MKKSLIWFQPNLMNNGVEHDVDDSSISTYDIDHYRWRNDWCLTINGCSMQIYWFKFFNYKVNDAHFQVNDTHHQVGRWRTDGILWLKNKLSDWMLRLQTKADVQMNRCHSILTHSWVNKKIMYVQLCLEIILKLLESCELWALEFSAVFSFNLIAE